MFEIVTVVVVDCARRTTALQINIKKQNAKGRADPIRGTLIVHSKTRQDASYRTAKHSWRA